MKSTGIVRKIDDLGRVVLPIELRRVLDLDKDASLEIYVDEGSIILKKYQPACIFCGSAEGVKQHQGRNICAECRAAIAQIEA
ncbi:MAG: AbrB/MazE/SpoVT family DNA-binding domain-containing protein [Ruthenibacterium sp.]